jgi:hypothetical protein
MPRANHFFLPGNVWHITHRCHKREFLLKFARDQRRWLRWLEDTKDRLGVRAMGRQVIGGDGIYELRDSGSPYEPDYGQENIDLSPKNAYSWDLSD